MAGKIRPIRWWQTRVELPDPIEYGALLIKQGIG
jgi:hypothetical protein